MPTTTKKLAYYYKNGQYYEVANPGTALYQHRVYVDDGLASYMFCFLSQSATPYTRATFNDFLNFILGKWVDFYIPYNSNDSIMLRGWCNAVGKLKLTSNTYEDNEEGKCDFFGLYSTTDQTPPQGAWTTNVTMLFGDVDTVTDEVTAI